MLILFCVVVIGLVDNILRPILVGRDTKMPDYVVLISTLGGMALFGLNGFVIGPLIAALFMASWDLFTGARGRTAGLSRARGRQARECGACSFRREASWTALSWLSRSRQCLGPSANSASNPVHRDRCATGHGAALAGTPQGSSLSTGGGPRLSAQVARKVGTKRSMTKRGCGCQSS